MPEVNQLFFQHKEIVELLIKKADIHDGKWVLAVNLGFLLETLGQHSSKWSQGPLYQFSE